MILDNDSKPKGVLLELRKKGQNRFKNFLAKNPKIEELVC